MRTIHTLIQAGVNPMAGDKVTVGLFMRGADKPRFAWSRSRAGMVRDLVDPDTWRLLLPQPTQGLLQATLRHAPDALATEQYGQGRERRVHSCLR